MSELLAALDELEGTHLIFTMANADTDGRVLIMIIKVFNATQPHAKSFTSLGQLRYFFCIKDVDWAVGNSPSVLAEVSNFKKGTVNIGDLQRGRLRVTSVIDCVPANMFIFSSINELYFHSFRRKPSLPDPGDPIPNLDASGLVVRLLMSKLLNTIPVPKVFHDGTYDQSYAGSVGNSVATL